jgi:hypothetical protein
VYISRVLICMGLTLPQWKRNWKLFHSILDHSGFSTESYEGNGTVIVSADQQVTSQCHWGAKWE